MRGSKWFLWFIFVVFEHQIYENIYWISTIEKNNDDMFCETLDSVLLQHLFIALLCTKTQMLSEWYVAGSEVRDQRTCEHLLFK